MPMDCQGVFCNDEKSVVKDTTSLKQLSVNLTKQPVEELKPLSPEMSTSQWRQKILSNWKYIKNNMNPIPVSKELHSSGFIRNDIVNQFMCQRRAVQATLLLIVSVPKIINEDKYKTFVQILCKSMIGLTDELGKDMQHSKVVPASLPNQRSLLEINRLQLIEKLQELYPVEFLLIMDDFVESGIFDIEDVADIISIRQFACKSREEASKSLIDKIISKSEQGSYTYLVRNLEKYGNRFQKILLELKDTPKPIIPDIKISDITLVETHIKMIDEQKEPKNGILTLTLNNKKNEDTENKIKDMVVSVNHDLLKNGLMLDKVTKGSVMIHIKSLDGDIRKQMIKMVNDNSMVSILEKLFHQTDIQKVLTEGKIRVEMKFETTQTNEYLIKGNEPPKCPPVSMIDANKSFLIEEIDTYTLSKAFEKKNIKSFIDANLETIPLREERVIHFLQILQRENLVGEFKKIVKEENMTIISERLQTYERVHATESQSLSQNICKSVTNIIRALDIDDVKDTFVERNIFEAGMFEDMEEKYQCLEREQLMGLFIAEILRSGTDAVLTFVDALYMNNMDQIANDILEPFPKNKECSIIKPTKKEESKDDSQSSLVFTGAFEFSVQIEGTEQANAISYLNKTTKNTPENSVEIQKTLEIWRKNDEMFVDTRAARHVHKCIKASNCITVTGSSGLGKTATVRHVALLMAYDGYKIIPITDPCDISNFYIPFCKTLFVVDDLCGKYSLNQIDIDKWKSQIQCLEPYFENSITKIIASCRLQIYQDKQFEMISLFRLRECNLLSKKLCLLETEKTNIAVKYLGSNANMVKKYYDLYDFFPLLCKLYKEHPRVNISEFFGNPYSVYEGELDKLCKERSVKYCALALCVMLDNHVNEEWLTTEIDTYIETVIKNTCEACKLNRDTSKHALRDELDSMLHTFIRKNGNIYNFFHDKVFDFMVFYFGKVMIECLIKNAIASFISSRFVFHQKKNSDMFVIIVPTKYQSMYISRMVDDLFKNNVTDVFFNSNMYVSRFRREFLCHVQALHKHDQKELAHKTDEYGIKNTVLIATCFHGDTSLLKWCINNGVDVKLCRQDGVSPLFTACQEGHTEIVNILLKNKADINKCMDLGASPLYIACQKGFKEIVNMLLNNEADINQCINTGVSPLYIACENGHRGIVNTLLNNKADINMCKNTGVSPLYVACQNGHTEIVNSLVNSKADINQCMNTGASPLYITCENGYTEIVNILLNNKADINKSKDTGASPLYIACQNGFTEIVNILLNNEADINQCINTGVSPLFIACQKGFTEIVNILLNNKADINKCKDTGASPLYIACQKGHTEIVNILLNNKADVNTCDDSGASPLYIACENGYTEIVNILLNNKADINSCINTGVSPLYMACEKGHSDIINILLNKKADINKCKDTGASPLYIACQNGFTEIVNILLNNEADVNTCDDSGASPLYIACEKGHTDVVSILLNNEADINQCINTGVSPLFIACQKGFKEMVNILLNNKADINKCKDTGASPLYIACQKGHTEIVNILLNNKADVNTCDDSGASPLYIACEKGHTDVVSILLHNKADVNKCTHNEMSPINIAILMGHKLIEKALNSIQQYT